MSELKEAWSGAECCFKCAYVIGIGSKCGYEPHRDRNGAADDPICDPATGSLCLHNPDAKGKGLGLQGRVCDMFELDTERWHDLKTQRWEWENAHREDGCTCEDDDEDYEPADPEHDAIKLPMDVTGFRMSKDWAVRVVEWFNGGHPLTLRMPVSVMKNGKVTDTEMIPIIMQKRDVWRSLELEIMHMDKYDRKATVALKYDTEKKNSGLHSVDMSDVIAVEYRDGKLILTGCDEGSEQRILEVEVIDEPEVKAKHAPKWYLDEMTLPISEVRVSGSAVAEILGGAGEIDWLHPVMSMSCQTARKLRQFSLEEFS